MHALIASYCVIAFLLAIYAHAATLNVVGFGRGSYGQLCDGNGIYSITSTPVVDANNVMVGKTVTQVAPGQWVSLMLLSDGTVVGMGSNQAGTLGDGTSSSTQQNNPVAVKDINNVMGGRKVIKIALTYYHAALLLANNTIVTMGLNDNGQLGNTNYIHFITS
jgi:alpha-tubulin suppressor-like RCC1 family protein